MNKTKSVGLVIIAVIIAVALPTAFIVESSTATVQQPTKEIDFTVTGSNDCLRFFNSTVSVCYVPFTVAANSKGELTINCTKMPGGANGYTDIYIYNGYWDNGTNNKCMSADLYPILSYIQNANFEIKGTAAFNESYGGSTQESYTVFFVFPPGGQATFHVTYQPIN